ncbi:MAG: outer membrane lipoprotein-sorting protein [Verrucomicrobiota bacterium]
MIPRLPIAICCSFAFLISAHGQDAPDERSDFANKTIDQLTADEVLKLVRYSYTLYDREFEGALRLGLVKKVPFLMSLKPDSIRFIFDNPAQVIYLDTKGASFALYEGIGGAELEAVSPSKYGENIRGTDVTYDDLSMRFLYWPNAKISRKERIKQRDCWVVLVRNPDGKGAYASVEVWIDQSSGAMLKMIGYNAQGRPIRRFEVLHGKKFGDIWMVDEMRIMTINPANGQMKSSTRMQIKSLVE